MFVFISLVISLYSLNFERFLDIFRDQYSEIYVIDQYQKEGNSVSFVVMFSQKYVSEFRERFSELGEGISLFCDLLHNTKNYVTINENGIIIIRSNITKEFSEFDKHYISLTKKIITSLHETGDNTISMQNTDSDVFFYSSGKDIQMNDFFEEMNDTLRRLAIISTGAFNFNMSYIIQKIVRKIQPIFGIVSGSFSKWNQQLIQLQTHLYRNANHIGMTHTTLTRITITSPSPQLQSAINSSSTTASHLNKAATATERTSKAYSNYVNSIGLFLTLIGIAIGIFFAGFNLSDTIRFISLVISSGLIAITILSWINYNGKQLLVSELRILKEIL